MSSMRSRYRVRRKQHEFDQRNYINNLPDLDIDGDFQSEPFVARARDNSPTMEFDSEFSPTSDSSNLSDSTDDESSDQASPPKVEYIEVVFEALISRIGLNLSESEKVVNLINSVNSRFSRDPVTLPSMRYYWDSKSRSSNVCVYILCNKSHAHGPYYGEPRYYKTFICENEEFPANIVSGEFFLNIPLRNQLESIISNLPESCWFENLDNSDISTAKQAQKVKSERHPNISRFTLTIHADEVSTSKSSNEKLFPVFVSINELKPEFRRKFFLMVNLFVGKNKPKVELYLSPLCAELSDLEINPVVIGSSFKATFHVIGLVADAPMRAYLRNVYQYNHLNGCDWCLSQAASINGARSYSIRTQAELIHLKRNKEDFIQFKTALERERDNFQQFQLENPRFLGLKGVSPLLSLKYFDIVDGISVEPMHCISLGIFRNILMKGILNSENSSPLFEKNVNKTFFKNQLSERLVSISVTSEFTRRPRNLDYIKFWKSSEYDAFLAYFLFTTSKGLLKNSVINHLLCLSRIYYLSHNKKTGSSIIAEIRNLVEEFQNGCASLYGKSFLTYNLHILSHLADSVENLGPNSTNSSYPLEDYMGIIKNKVHRYSNIGPSLIRFFMSDFRFKEYQISRIQNWNITTEEKKNFGCEEDKESFTSIVEKIQDTRIKIEVAAIIQNFVGIDENLIHSIVFIQTVKFIKKRFSTIRYCSKKIRDDSYIKDDAGIFYKIIYIVKYNSRAYLVCQKVVVKKIEHKFKGFTGFFSFPLENFHEISKTLPELVCLPLVESLSKVILVKSSTFHFKYKADFFVEQFLQNK